MTPTVAKLVRFTAGWSVATLVVFLFLADFFSAWSGRLVSVRSSKPDQVVVQVLVAPDDGERFEANWPKEAIEGLDLTIDPLALPPKPLPAGLPRTEKSRFALTYDVRPEGGGVRVVATTGPRPMALAILFFFLGIGFRNMVVAGSPFAIARPEGPIETHTAAPPDPPSGSGKRKKARGKKGPPPARRRKGGRRR